MHQVQPQHKLFEGLRSKDLKDLVDNVFTIDQFKSKMGEDKDVVVLGFRVSDKYPAIDLMEFIEKGYTFILDADMSTGEERDGKYQVFVELERSSNIAGQIKNLLEGVSQLCDCWDWRFRYHKEVGSVPVSETSILEHVPTSAEEYENKILEFQNTSISDFFNQGGTESSLSSTGIIKITKPYSESLTLQLESIGDYCILKDILPGAIQLDESSRAETVYLEKYLGNYEIHKINNKFLIRNGDRAIIVSKDSW